MPAFFTPINTRRAVHFNPTAPPFPPPADMDPILTRTLLLLLLFFPLVSAATFTQCLENFRNDPNAIGGVDSKGHPTTPAEAVGLTHKTCTVMCGSNAEGFLWKDFAQLFASWLLPWLALISQLPFGSGSYADDFISG